MAASKLGDEAADRALFVLDVMLQAQPQGDQSILYSLQRAHALRTLSKLLQAEPSHDLTGLITASRHPCSTLVVRLAPCA